jgi:hypothetical protein
MATKCICNKNETLRIKAVSNVRANTKITVGNPLRIITGSNVRDKYAKEQTKKLKLQSVFNLIDNNKLEANSIVRTDTESSIKGLLDVSGVLHASVRGEFNIREKPHKFGGYTNRLKALNFQAQEKLYPSSDITTVLNGVGFRDQNLGTTSIYSGIDEGVYTGNIFKDSTFVTDDSTTYISPYVSGTDNNLTYRFGVNPLNTKAEESFFVMRASGSLSNNSSDISPLYKFTNIKLLDPSGTSIITYRDLVFKGDGYFATYFSEPVENKAALYTYQTNYPKIGSGNAVGNSGYSVTFDLEIDCLDDPFDEGYNIGYEELKCEISDSAIDTIRISAIEIQNSGSLAPVDQGFVGLYSLPPSKGNRLVRHIFPDTIFASGYGTTIYPSGKSRWESNAYLDAASFQNSGEKSVGGVLTGYSRARYLRLKETSNSIPDSGKLILQFKDKPQVSTINKVDGEFGGGFYRREFPRNDYRAFPLQDTFYADIDEINLKIIARKAVGSRDFALDVVGYSDDKLLAVTSPSGGFLQNQVAGSGEIPASLTEDAFGTNRTLSDGSISEGSDLSSTTQILNSGGDHYLLTQTPLINSEYFTEYTIPLKIHDIIPDVGQIKQFNQSTYFESIYLDIYPIPSGADIADIRLEVYYKPGNAIPMSIVGHQQDKVLSRDTVVLDIAPAKAGDPAFNKGGLSSFGTLPHGYTDVDNLKTNYSRRWQGVVGKEYISAFAPSGFDFSFEKDEKRNPFASGFYDFSIINGNHVVSTYDEFPRSGLFSANLSASVFDHLGWRFNSSGILSQSSQTYKTTDWASGNHVLSGKIADAFAHAVRVSGESGYFTFNNAPTSGSFTTFIRFTPDETVSGVGYNQFNSGVLFSKDNEFGLRYSGDYLQAYVNTAGGEVNATDTLAYSGYSYPLSVATSYDGSNLRLYIDNEIARTSHNILRATSTSATKINTENNLILGSGMNMFVSAFGVTDDVVPSANSTLITISDLFDQYRMVFASGETSYQHRNNLWSYVNEDADTDWKLGAFRHCNFSQAFDRLSNRADLNYIEHKLTHDGLPYSSRTNLTLPTNVKTADLSYHTQLENDFLRFHLKDVPTVDGSGKFYSADLRINKNLPRGYNFNEQAFVVETVVDADSVENILWPNGDIGPKLIVSLYSKAALPTVHSGTPNYGLINRHIHNIDHECFEKISSTFDYDNLFDESEPWADFVQEAYLQEFNHKYYSTEVDDMFLQYDVAYPTSSGSFESKIRLHAAEIKLKKALVELPTIADNFTLYASGNTHEREGLNLFFVGPYSGIAFNQPSGLTLFSSGSLPDALSNSGNLYVSGEDPYQSFGMFVNPHATFTTSGEFFGSYGSSPIYGLQMFVSNSGEIQNTDGMNLSTINTDVVPSAINSVQLISYSQENAINPLKSTANLFAKSPSFTTVNNIITAGMNFTTKLTNRYLVNHTSPFPLTVRSEVEKLNNNFNLYTINAPPADFDTEQKRQAINWDGTNTGEDIVVAENAYSSLPADDEIRGVTTLCFGDCVSAGNCTTRAIVTHGTDWNNSECIDGGIARAQSTYTNSGVVAFNTNTDGYDRNFYGIRKYSGLIPHYPYTITIHGFTGSSEPIAIPPMINTVGYGASDEVNYSGIKHFASDPNAIKARYGKSVAMRGDLMAIGAPNYTLVDSSGSMEDSGAVFLYRRNPAPSGFDWSEQEDQASWNLEEVLTLPSGFEREYSYVTTDTIGEEGASYTGNVRKWIIGQRGRNFGYSVDIVSDPSDETKDVVVVGAPRAKFSKTFDEAPVKKIKAVFIVISDNLDTSTNVTSKTSPYKSLNSFIVSRNRYFRNIANPAFEIEPTYIVLSATNNLGLGIVNQISTLANTYPEYQGHEINRIISINSLDADSLVIENQIKDIFKSEFPQAAGITNSGMPAVMGLFVDNSNSLGRYAVEPAIDNFKTFFKEYTFASGLLDASDNPISGLVVESTTAPEGEDWIFPITQITNSLLSNTSISNNLNYFTNNFDPISAPATSGYNDVPTSGGRVYIFEREQATSGLFYDSNQYIWTNTQEIGLDRFLYDVEYKNERFGHAVAISTDSSKIAIGSPYDDSIGVRVYEKSSTYNLNHYYSKIGDWLTRRVEENVDDVTSTYYKLYQRYQSELDDVLVATTAGKNIYNTLTPSGRFDLKLYCETYGGGAKDKYSEIFTYKNDYNYTGTWSFVPERLAARPRVGYSVALNDDGNLLAIGCPTDSMNQHDDTNVYHRNTKHCSEDKGVNGLSFIPGYDSPLDEDSDLVTGKFNDGGHEGTFQSYVNAGAVQLFDSRRYYPHNKAVEYGIFGNKQHSVASSGDKLRYFDIVSGVYTSANSYVKTSFTDPEIPQDAGLLFINTPEVDSLSDEVLQNIKQWLDLGDRNLVLVGNDPTWEDNGAYEQSNKILNNILDRLGSRMRLHPARNQYHALSTVSGINTIRAKNIQEGYSSYINPQDMQASGVADIRLHDPTLKTYSHDCSIQFHLANLSCQPDIKHEGDLRAEWFGICTDIKGNCVFPPRNLQAAYGIIPGLVPPLCDEGVGCFKVPGCNFAVNTDNIYKAPIPVLAAAEPHPEMFKTIPAVPDSTGVNQVCSYVPDPTHLDLEDTDEFKTNPAFYIYSSGISESYSGVYENLETNWSLTADNGCEWFKPESLSRDYILQASSTSFSQDRIEKSVFVELPAWCAETTYASSGKESYVSLIASVAPETYDVLNAGSDKMLQLYTNLLSKRLTLRNNVAGSVQFEEVYVAQLGGWTNRTSFKDGHKDSILKSEFDGKFIGLGGRPKAHVTENVVATSADDLTNYDIVWIANTDQIPTDSEAEVLKQWLNKGNKRIIITYGCTPDGNLIEPSVVHANAAYQLCEKLNIDIKPAYLPHQKKFAGWTSDAKALSPIQPAAGNSFLTPFNANHPLYSDNLPTRFNELFGDNLDQRALRRSQKEGFIPIQTSVLNYVAYFGSTPRFNTILPLNVIDETTVSEDKHYINSGWAKLSVKLPEIQNSGYIIEIDFAAEDPAENTSILYKIVTENLANKNYIPNTNPRQFTYSTAGLGLQTLQDSPAQGFTDKITGTATTKYTFEVANKTLKIGPLWGTETDAAIYIAANDISSKNLPFNTLRVASIIGYPVPTKIGSRRVCVDGEPFVIPGRPSETIKVSPPRRPISTPSDFYCASQESECLDLFKTPYNQRKFPAGDECNGAPRPLPEDQKILGDLTGPHDTADGPVIVAQEYYLGNNFEAGVARSRITVISDASLIQSQSAYDNDGNRKISNVNFVESLYPLTSFPEDVIYNTRFKITSPERGSPYKWYSATGNSGLIERFIRNDGAVTPRPMSSFRGNESELNPAYVVRPMEFCECFDSPFPCIKDELEVNYVSGLITSLNPYPQFSTTIDGKLYVDDNELFKDTGYDYLDFEIYKDGYPGDLFGFDVKISNNRLFVGAPFAAYSQDGVIVDWDDISSGPSGQVPSGVELSSYGGAGAVYMFEKTLTGGKYIRNKNATFVKNSGSLDWSYSRKFRPEDIHVGQDLILASQSLPPSSLDSNNYTSDQLTTLTKQTDRFGFSLDVQSGILVVGAPGHDFGNFIEDGQTSGLFMSKAFDASFPLPQRVVHDLGSSGVRNAYPESGVRIGSSGIKFGATVLNNGAAFIFSEDYDYGTEKNYWRLLQKIVPEGINSNRQFAQLGSSAIDTSGAENSRFGSAVAVNRNTRSDSDYAILVGSKNHPFDSGNDLEAYKENKGAAYTYDLILNKRPPALADSGAFIGSKLFAESGTPKLHDEIYLTITNSGLNNQQFQNNGIIFSNSDGEIFLEVSGQDKSQYQYIKHRPYISAVYGSMLAGTTDSDAFRLFVEGRPNEASGNINMMVLGSGMADVYNNVGLVTFGATGFASGVPSGLYLFNNAENPLSLSNSGNLYVSGSSFVPFSGTPSGLGFFVSGLLPVDNSGELNVFVSG